jgi:hypothetical protein
MDFNFMVADSQCLIGVLGCALKAPYARECAGGMVFGVTRVARWGQSPVPFARLSRCRIRVMIDRIVAQSRRYVGQAGQQQKK